MYLVKIVSTSALIPIVMRMKHKIIHILLKYTQNQFCYKYITTVIKTKFLQASVTHKNIVGFY